ncbi:MAG: PQQ-binding-like beta-propeller repeat protein [Candidatus Eremiobacteraeota bacterium]|nr:PQQ-binding-like beta-propeller repeat protein [Candidatus Eremiobacteraeota bacterium]
MSALLVGVALAGCGGGGSVTPALHGPGTPNGSTVRDDWAMYAHDARHTSTSVASIGGALKVAWRYDPQPITGDNFSSSFNAIATVSGVYLHWDQFGSGVFSGGPSYDGISISGQRLWSYCEHKDFDEGHWVSVFHSNVVFEDDGQQFLDVNSGAVVKTPAKKWSTGYDLWGESIPDTSGLYSANTFLADGADLFVYSLDATGAARWTQNQQKSTKYSQDQAGGLVLSNGVLFYAANYSDPSPFASGIYALDAASGHQVAYRSTIPWSEMSADATNIYLVEQGPRLVARAQSDLHPVWSVSISTTSYAAPVIVNGLVIVASGSGIEAHNAGSGSTAWTAAVPTALSPGFTGMAAAGGSNTLLVASGQNLYVLNLSNGTEIWHGKVAGAVGSLENPVIVNDPSRGAVVYVTDGRGVIALIPG